MDDDELGGVTDAIAAQAATLWALRNLLIRNGVISPEDFEAEYGRELAAAKERMAMMREVGDDLRRLDDPPAG